MTTAADFVRRRRQARRTETTTTGPAPGNPYTDPSAPDPEAGRP